MANESSAIVQLISTAQQEHHAIQDSSGALPDFTDDLKPIRRSYKGPLLILGVLLFAGAAALAGVFVGMNYLGEFETAPEKGAGQASEPASAPPASAPPASAPPASAPSASAPEQASAGAPAASPAPTATPAPSASAPWGDPDPAAPAAAPAQALTPQNLAATGFDIRVKPQATITLDGRVLGKSPLRVRNLTPGAHVVDIEAPAGFFSRRVELELDAGEPQNVNLALDPIDPVDEVAAAGKKKKEVKAAKSRREKRRAKRKARRSRSKPRGEVAEALALPDEADKGTSAGGLGTLMLGSKPPCDIYIDGEATGLKTPQRAIELAAGTHKVTLVNTELDIKKSFTVKISSGKRTRAIHDLTGKI